jgi:hypothetical protein
MGVCNPTCNTGDQIRTYPIPCNLQEATRKGGFESFILIDCDAVMYSLTDATEWATLVAADQIIVSPKGFGTLIQPDNTLEKLSACSPESVIDTIAGFDWNTKLFDNTTYVDFDFEYDLKNKAQNKTVLWLGCDGLLYFDYNWATGENPGFANISVNVYRVSEPDQLQTLNVEARFNTYGTNLKGIALTPSVLSVLFP